jgi:hypothetical protein
VKNHKIAKNLATTKHREKISTDLESLEFKEFCNIRLTKFKSNQILLNKFYTKFYKQPSYLLVKDPHYLVFVHWPQTLNQQLNSGANLIKPFMAVLCGFS